MEGSDDVLAEIPVAQHHALGVAGGPGSIDDGRQVVSLRLGRMAFACEGMVVLLDETRRSRCQ